MGWVVSAKSQSIYLRETDAVPIVQEAGWTPGTVWTGAQNLAQYRDSIHGPSKPYRAAISTELSRPCHMLLAICILRVCHNLKQLVVEIPFRAAKSALTM